MARSPLPPPGTDPSATLQQTFSSKPPLSALFREPLQRPILPGPRRTSQGGLITCVPSWTDVVEIAARFPGVEEGLSWGTPGLKVRGKFMCRMRTNPDALVMRVIDLEDAQALLRGQ